MDKLLQELIEWLPRQRWFAANGRKIHAMRIERATELIEPNDGSPGAVLVVALVSFEDGQLDRYQVPVGFRRSVPASLRHAVFADIDGYAVYDALADADLVHGLLLSVATERERGDLRFSSTRDFSVSEKPGVRPITQEQSNSSVVIDDRMILKVFRRLEPGVNQDIELQRALEAAGNPHVVSCLGALHGILDGTTTTLFTLQEFVADASSGWEIALEALRASLYRQTTQDVEANLLGRAVATVHRDLAATYGVSVLDVDSLARDLKSAADTALQAAPQLAEYSAALCELIDSLLSASGEQPRAHRVHGDLHLGQTLRSAHGWIVLDFEGEPDRPLSTRVLPTSPWRDVAGMLRSYDYAADYTLSTLDTRDAVSALRTRQWAEFAKSAFLDGYRTTVGSQVDRSLLDAFVLGKALYEVAYEARHRPSWTSIPLAGVLRLLEGRNDR